ncbi:MAG TPA: hypothetical protein ENN76_01890 [Euryarchaeota archaeon]|nr:hypothetical protein [Euryarchaeota archaeon]
MRCWHGAGLAFFVLVIALLLLSPLSKGADIGVLNVPPAFDTIAIDTSNVGRFNIDLIIFDYNGHDRIYKVLVNFYVGNDLLASFSAQYYDTPGMNSSQRYSEKEAIFKNEYQNFLIPDECETGPVPTIISDNFKNLQVTFSFHPLEANTIEIICIDTQNASAVHVGPFLGNPGFLLQNAVLPVTLSGVAAVAGAAGLSMLRLNKNKLARLAEKRISGR